MPQVEFIADFDFRAKENVVMAYKAGTVENVTTECAKQAIAEKKAVAKAKKIED